MRVAAVVFSVVVCTIGVVASNVSARPSHGVRRVQLISMQAGPLAASADLSTVPPPSHASDVQLPEAFRIHDLSRRYVEYRMAHELADASQPGNSALQEEVISAPVTQIAATSSIAVPGWMRGSYSGFAPLTYTPGCSALAYRPAGFLPRDAETRRAAYYGMMSAIACEQGIPTGLFDAMIIRESGYNPGALSRAGAFGPAQLMPATAASLGVDRYNPMQNMRGGARYLRQQLDRFGQVHLALAAYNAGPGRVRGGMIPRIAETQAYVSNILANWTRLGRVGGQPANPFQQPARPGRQVELAAF